MNNFLVVLAVSLLMFGCGKQNKKLNFEKIIFHTSLCFGSCNVYHLEINNENKVKLYAEHVYKSPDDFSFKEDTAKIGYFNGIANDTSFNKLVKELQTIDIETLEFDGTTFCDGSVITIIVYYDKKRKFLQSMTPPSKADNLIPILTEICEKSKLQKVNEGFKIENKEQF